MLEQILQAISSIKVRLDRLESKSYGGRWVDWTPTVTQSGAVALSTAIGGYCIIGKVCHVYVQITCSGAGTANNQIWVGGLPAIMYATVESTALGVFNILRPAVTTRYVGAVRASAGGLFEFTITGTANGKVGVDPNFALANGDFINFSATYLVA